MPDRAGSVSAIVTRNERDASGALQTSATMEVGDVMASITKEQIDILIELQTIETDRYQLQKRLEAKPAKLKSLDEEIESQGSALAGDEQSLTDLKRDYRTFEADMKINAERIKKLQERLRSVKTNREYQATLKEIDDLKAKNSAIEDRALETMDRIDAVEAAVAKEKEDLSLISEEIKQDRAAIEKEMAEEQQRLSELEKKRQDTAGRLDPSLMRTYHRILGLGYAVAIAPVVQSVCQGCNMNIPPQMFNELQRFDSLKFCPFCERILYWKPACEDNGISEEAAASEEKVEQGEA